MFQNYENFYNVFSPLGVPGCQGGSHRSSGGDVGDRLPENEDGQGRPGIPNCVDMRGKEELI